MKYFWLFIARKRIHHNELIMQYPAIDILGKYGNLDDFYKLLELVDNNSQIIRNLVSRVTKNMIKNKFEDIENYNRMKDFVPVSCIRCELP